MSASVAVGAVVTLATLIPPLHQRIKQWCQPALWELIPQQLQPVQWAQRFQHPILEWMVLLSAATVTVEFYVGGLAIMIWCGLQRQAILLLGLLGLLGESMSKRSATVMKHIPTTADSKLWTNGSFAYAVGLVSEQVPQSRNSLAHSLNMKSSPSQFAYSRHSSPL